MWCTDAGSTYKRKKDINYQKYYLVENVFGGTSLHRKYIKSLTED
jgi:hypothetical protein